MFWAALRFGMAGASGAVGITALFFVVWPFGGKGRFLYVTG